MIAASLNYDPVNFDTAPNGIGVYLAVGLPVNQQDNFLARSGL